MKVAKSDLIEEWLKKGDDNAKKIINLPWNVIRSEEENGINLFASYPRFPFTLLFRIDNYNTVIALDMKFPTDSLNVQDRLDIYRKLLLLNGEIPYSKFSLVGDDLNVVIVSEIETSKVDRDMLNDRMEAILNSAYKMAQALNLQEELQQVMLENIVATVKEKIEKGASKDNVMEYLITKLKISSDMAEKIVEEVEKQMKQPGKSETTEDMYV